MTIKEISKEEFDLFAKTHILGSFYQTSTYGELLGENDYKDLYIGAYEDDILKGASLILTKTISLNVKYGYAPRGFLIDYLDSDFLAEFTKALKKYFNKKGFAFIKINPIITLSELNTKDGSKTTNQLTYNLINTLEENGYKKLKDNLYFESVLPKYNPIVTLKNFNFNYLDNKLQNKLNRVSNKGMKLIKGDLYNINTFYELVRKKDDVSDDFYKSMFKSFSEKDMIDLFLIEVDYHDYLMKLQEDHTTEETLNEKINKIFQVDPNNKQVFNEKMLSDKKFNEINKEISDINIKVQSGVYKEIVAAALVIKYKNIAYMYTSGFNKNYNRLYPNHFLHYQILNYYKNNNFDFMDLNGITGDFTKDNPYKGLNDFKLSWNPRVFEYIGEFDLIINQTKYSLLWSTKTLHKEFEKKGLKSIS